ncbi:cytochrome c oxidase-assembly factor COX23, mitochondrial [Trichophyton interdigitale MR816]|uniref:Cytochrome c oxidase-assembly factor COX23, mitochondrial n=1 Tax=Trichophyton interdigitale (strain MR816) TaxID=1215338 RepID=A0A059J8A8_TRIIM|nr:cytochrome c oxidase-assembly factor COX23, mitochondrial [Trichophyton interdigitale MR816]
MKPLPAGISQYADLTLGHSKSASEYMDPCQDFADRSIKCMRRNNGDRDMCTDYFQAYRDCKKAWVSSITSHTVCFMAIFT